MTIYWYFYSLDFNLIDQFWFKLKKHVYKICLDIEEVRNNDKIVSKVLFKKLKKLLIVIDEI